MKANEIFNEMFGKARDDRSPEYRQGVLAWLKYKLKEEKEINVPYQKGTCQFDAFFAGLDERRTYPIN